MISDPERPDFEMLLDWLEGWLPSDVAAQVDAYVSRAGPRTHATVEWLRGFLVTARSLPLHEPPPIVRQSLIQHFTRWSRARTELDHHPREVRPRLLFDSRQDRVLAGVRAGDDTGDAIHLAYTADEADLLVDIYHTGAGLVRVDGQVLLAQPQGAPVFEASVCGAGLTCRTKDGDELGRFSLRDVPEAHCQLRMSNGLITIVADLDLRPGGEQP